MSPQPESFADMIDKTPNSQGCPLKPVAKFVAFFLNR